MEINSCFKDECEVLKAIMDDELQVKQITPSTVKIEITLHPKTGDEHDQKNVCITFSCYVNLETYPKEIPRIELKNPRGLSDAHFISIEENLKSLAYSKINEEMLYDLLDYTKDSLTDNNRPSSNCPICFDQFQEDFFKTNCYHYFHLHCINEYIDKREDKKYPCPVCRLEMNLDEKLLDSTKSQLHKGKQSDECEHFTFDAKYHEWLEECKILFERQQENGGIIDLEYEKNKYLVSSSSSSNSPENSGGTPDNSNRISDDSDETEETATLTLPAEISKQHCSSAESTIVNQSIESKSGENSSIKLKNPEPCESRKPKVGHTERRHYNHHNGKNSQKSKWSGRNNHGNQRNLTSAEKNDERTVRTQKDSRHHKHNSESQRTDQEIRQKKREISEHNNHEREGGQKGYNRKIRHKRNHTNYDQEKTTNDCSETSSDVCECNNSAEKLTPQNKETNQISKGHRNNDRPSSSISSEKTSRRNHGRRNNPRSRNGGERTGEPSCKHEKDGNDGEIIGKQKGVRGSNHERENKSNHKGAIPKQTNDRPQVENNHQPSVKPPPGFEKLPIKTH